MPELTPLLLAGEPAAGGDGGVLDVENPADESSLATVAAASERDVATAVAEAVRAQPAWAATPAAERAALLYRLAALLERDTDRLSRIVVAELGKPLREAREEVAGAAGFCRFFAGVITAHGGEVLPSAGRNQQLLIRREPIGVVAGIIPWNFPLALAARKVAPALVAGNAVILKPAEVTPLSALAFGRLAVEAGLPRGLLSVLPGEGPRIGGALVRAPEIGFVSMTGSLRAGRSILAGAAERVLPVSLELGGKAPFVVFDDADLDAAVDAAVRSRMMNNGQACVCNERSLVQRSIYDSFVHRVAERMAALRVGDPTEESTEVGPKVSAAELAKVARIVDDSVAAGAELITGGSRGDGPGHWYAPTVLAQVPASAPALREEVFGPVLPVVPFDDEAEALRLANDSDYGLSSYLYTENYSRVMRMVPRLGTGEVFVNRPGPEETNGYHGGWGLSGLGGDDGIHGLEAYLRKQSVYLSWSER